MIYSANLPRYLWGEALLSACYIYNLTPHSSLEGYISPYEAESKTKPVNKHLFIWGSLYYYRDNKPKKKLDQQGYKAVLIGYNKETNIYKVWNLKAKKALWTRNIKIFEDIFLKPIKSI